MKKIRLAHVPFILLALLVITVVTSSSKLLTPAHAQTPEVVTPQYNCLGPCPTFTPTPTKVYQTIPTATQPPYYAPTATPQPYGYAPTATVAPYQPCVAVAPTQTPYGYTAPTQPPYGYTAPTQTPYGYVSPTKTPYGYVAPTTTPYGYVAPTQPPYYAPTVAPYTAPAGYVAPNNPYNKKTQYNQYTQYNNSYYSKYRPSQSAYNPYTANSNTYTQNPQPRSYGGFLSNVSAYSANTYGVGANPNPGYTAPAPVVYQNTPYQPAPTPCPPPYQVVTPNPYQVVTATPQPYYQVVTATPNPYQVVTATPQPYIVVSSAPVPSGIPGSTGTPCYSNPSYSNQSSASSAQAPDQRRGYKRFRSHHDWDGFLGMLFRLFSQILGYRDPNADVPPCAPAPVVSGAPIPVTTTGALDSAPSVSPSEAISSTAPCTMPLGSLNANTTANTNTQDQASDSANITSSDSANTGNISTGGQDNNGFLKDFFQFFYFFINLILKIINGSSPC